MNVGQGSYKSQTQLRVLVYLTTAQPLLVLLLSWKLALSSEASNKDFLPLLFLIFWLERNRVWLSLPLKTFR